MHSSTKSCYSYVYNRNYSIC